MRRRPLRSRFIFSTFLVAGYLATAFLWAERFPGYARIFYFLNAAAAVLAMAHTVRLSLHNRRFNFSGTVLAVAVSLTCWQPEHAMMSVFVMIAWLRVREAQLEWFIRPDWINGDAFYYTSQWRKLRTRVIRKYGRRCMKCDARPTSSFSLAKRRAFHVDHIKPRSKYPHLMLQESNLQVLCESCNRAKGNWDETDYR